MKNGWEIKEFENCLEKVVYTNKIKRKDFLENGEYPIVSQEQDFINGYWNNADDLFEVKKPVVIFGDHTQVLKYVDFDFVLGADGVKILQPKNGIDSRYFYYFLQNINLGSLGYARHYSLLKEIKVSYPKSLSEQQRIGAILDEASAAIDKAKANAKKNLQNSRELFDSYLNKVFANQEDGWEEKKLIDVCTLQRGFDLPKRLRKSGQFPLVSSSGIIDTHCEYKVKSPGVVTGRSGSIGNVFHVAKDFWPLNTVLYIKDFHGNDSMFIYHLLKQFGLNKYASGAGVPTLNRNNVHDELIKVPTSIDEQKQIVIDIENLSTHIKSLESLYQQKLADFEELKKSILQKAFEGQL